MDDTHVYFELPFATTAGLRKVSLAGDEITNVPAPLHDVLAVHDGYAYTRESTSSFTGDNLNRKLLAGGTVEQVHAGPGKLYSPRVAQQSPARTRASRRP